MWHILLSIVLNFNIKFIDHILKWFLLWGILAYFDIIHIYYYNFLEIVTIIYLEIIHYYWHEIGKTIFPSIFFNTSFSYQFSMPSGLFISSRNAKISLWVLLPSLLVCFNLYVNTIVSCYLWYSSYSLSYFQSFSIFCNYISTCQI